VQKKKELEIAHAEQVKKLTEQNGTLLAQLKELQQRIDFYEVPSVFFFSLY